MLEACSSPQRVVPGPPLPTRSSAPLLAPGRLSAPNRPRSRPDLRRSSRKLDQHCPACTTASSTCPVLCLLCKQPPSRPDDSDRLRCSMDFPEHRLHSKKLADSSSSRSVVFSAGSISATPARNQLSCQHAPDTADRRRQLRTLHQHCLLLPPASAWPTTRRSHPAPLLPPPAQLLRSRGEEDTVALLFCFLKV